MPPHLMIPVDLRKGKKSNSFLAYSALVNSGAIHNFIFLAVANSARMRSAKPRRLTMAVAKQPTIATVNDESLRTTAVVRYMV
jgi:hypothetical protein